MLVKIEVTWITELINVLLVSQRNKERNKQTKRTK